MGSCELFRAIRLIGFIRSISGIVRTLLPIGDRMEAPLGSGGEFFDFVGCFNQACLQALDEDGGGAEEEDRAWS